MVELGLFVVVVECDGELLLLIDCGFDMFDCYVVVYVGVLNVLYIMYMYMDYVVGLEWLFFKLWFDLVRCGCVWVFLYVELLFWL